MTNRDFIFAQTSSTYYFNVVESGLSLPKEKDKKEGIIYCNFSSAKIAFETPQK